MTADSTTGASAGARAALSRTAWLAMCELVLDNERRREVSDAVGLSFGRIRAIRRLARRPMALGELASVLGIDPPYATVVVDDLETLGLVRRRPHPTDRRSKLVEVTRKGRDLARRAEAVMSAPPAALSALDADDLGALSRILGRLSGDRLRVSDPGTRGHASGGTPVAPPERPRRP